MVYALASGASSRKGLGVRVSLKAQNTKLAADFNLYFLLIKKLTLKNKQVVIFQI